MAGDELSPDWFERIVEMTPEAIFVISDGYHAFANPAGLELLGAESVEQLADRPAIEFLTEEFRESGEARAHAARDGGRAEFVRERAIRLDGSIRVTEGSAAAVTYDGKPATLVIQRDITEQVAVDAARRRAESRFIAAVSGAPTGIGMLSANRSVVMANDAFFRLCAPELRVGARLDELLVTDDMAGFDALFVDPPGTADTVPEATEVRLLPAPGRTFEVSIREVGLDDDARYIVQMQDVTRQKEHEAILRRLAHTDDLTGLPSRRALTEEIRRELARPVSRIALAFCDLDNFKTINDSLGHQVGDDLLVAVADRLRGAVRPDDFLVRFGGDEFVVLLRNTDRVEAVESAVGRLIGVLSAPFDVCGRSHHVSASIGVSFGAAGDDPEVVLGDADAAMYDAKANGRGRYEMADSLSRTRAQTRLEIDRTLRVALERRELEPHFQPIVEVATGCIVGAEALVRWNRDGEMIPPNAFIPIAEANGMIGALDRYMIERSMEQLRRWMDAGVVGERFRISANIAPRELHDELLLRTLTESLERHRVGHHQLMLEVTERRAMETSGIAHAISSLRDLGVGLAVDDFGVGHSSLARLSEIPFEVLKLDQAFVAGAVEDPNKARLLDGVVRLGESLGHTVLAEGVETAEQLALLVDSRVELAQGYFLARPASADDITDLLRERAR